MTLRPGFLTNLKVTTMYFQSDNYFQILGFNGDTDHDGFSDPESEQIKR